MAKSLTVRRKGYKRKAYTAKRGGKKVRVSQRSKSKAIDIQDP